MKGRLSLTLLVVAALTIAAAASMPGIQAGSAQAGSSGETNPSYIEVEGTATIDVKPDVAYVTIGCWTQMSNARQAQEANAQKMDAVANKIMSMGVARDDIVTTGLRLYPVYDYSGKTERIVGYRADNSVRVAVKDLARVGDIVDAAVAAGANSLNQVSFSVKDPEAYHQQALAKAVEVAKARAEVVAKSSGVAVKGVRCVVENAVGVSSPQPIRAAMKVMADEAAAQTPIFEGEVTVRASVRVRFDI